MIKWIGLPQAWSEFKVVQNKGEIEKNHPYYDNTAHLQGMRFY